MAKSFGMLALEFINHHPECKSPSFKYLKVNFQILDSMQSRGDLCPVNLPLLYCDLMLKNMSVVGVDLKGVHLYNQLFLPVFRGSANVE